MKNEISEALRKRYPHQSEIGTSVREEVIKACEWYLSSGFGDGNASKKLCSDNHFEFWQQLSEVLLAYQLASQNILFTHPKHGPDFLVQKDGQKIWIEVITPEPEGLPSEWTNYSWGEAVSFPYQQMSLRWTSAIKKKSEKLQDYLKKGIIGLSDSYVVAINGRLLRGFGGSFPELYGISQHPFAVEAAFGLGPMQIHIDTRTTKATRSDYQHLEYIPKPNGKFVPVGVFFNPSHALVSAIWAVDIDEGSLLKKHGSMTVVHNPHAKNSIPEKFLPAISEYHCLNLQDHWQVRCTKGALHQNE